MTGGGGGIEDETVGRFEISDVKWEPNCSRRPTMAPSFNSQSSSSPVFLFLFFLFESFDEGVNDWIFHLNKEKLTLKNEIYKFGTGTRNRTRPSMMMTQKKTNFFFFFFYLIPLLKHMPQK